MDELHVSTIRRPSNVDVNGSIEGSIGHDKIIVDGTKSTSRRNSRCCRLARRQDAEIPRFCFHERLSIAGNCRMCLVEVKGGPPKPRPPARWRASDLRPGPNGEPPVVITKSPMAREGARRGDGISAHQPSARLPDLRPGRRMRSAGPGDGLWRRYIPLSIREQARGRGQIYGR